MINCIVLDNGNLLIELTPEGKEYLNDESQSKWGYWFTMDTLFESYSCNGSYVHFDAGDANPFVGLTSTPCIAQSISIEDYGARSINGKLWAFWDYQLIDDLELLKTEGRVIYQLIS